jgi:hypothetical protein
LAEEDKKITGRFAYGRCELHEPYETLDKIHTYFFGRIRCSLPGAGCRCSDDFQQRRLSPAGDPRRQIFHRL